MAVDVTDQYMELHQFTIFSSLTQQECQQLLAIAHVEQVASNTLIIEQNNPCQAIYIVLAGKINVEISRQDKTTKTILAEHGKGALVGGYGLVGLDMTTADVVTVTPSHLLRIDYDQLKNSLPETLVIKLQAIIARSLTLDIKQSNTKLLREEQLRFALIKEKLVQCYFFIGMVALLCLYTISLGALKGLSAWLGSSTPVSAGLLVLQTVAVIYLLLSNQRVLRDYGCNLINWRDNLIDMLKTTLPFLLLLLGLKYVYLHLILGLHHLPLIHPQSYDLPFSYGINSYYWVYLILYVSLIPFQEFLCRGATQTTVIKIFGTDSRVKIFICLLLPNLVFWVWHVHLSVMFGFISFVSGIYWSWLYLRQKSLLGPICSHMLIGVFVLFVMGVGDLFYAVPASLPH